MKVEIVKEPKTVYSEVEVRMTVSVNGKEVIVSKYNKCDTQFADYDDDINFEGEGLTDEEKDEVDMFIENYDW